MTDREILELLLKKMNNLENEVSEIKNDMALQVSEIKNDMALQVSEIRNDMTSQVSEIKNDMASQIAEIRKDMTSQIAEIKANMATYEDVQRVKRQLLESTAKLKAMDEMILDEVERVHNILDKHKAVFT